MVANDIGQLLHRWRSARGLTQSALAVAAGVHISTLSRWESGARRPLLPELEAVCDALGLTNEQKMQALQLVSPGRLHRLENITGVRPPLIGDLLRAMRMRRHLTQTQVAAWVGVRQGTLAKWEASEDWPSTERLHRLCYFLQAREEELLALLLGRFTSPVSPLPHASLDDLERRYQAGGDSRLWELNNLSYMAAVWPYALRQDRAKVLLLQIDAEYAHTLGLHKRFPEIEPHTARALTLTRESGRVTSFTLMAVINQARFIARSAEPNAYRQARAVLQDWLPQATSTDVEAWLLSEIGRYYADEGDYQTALYLDGLSGSKTMPTGGLCGETTEGRLITARLLLRANRPEDALSRLSAVEPQVNRETAAEVAITQARVLLALNQSVEAGARLQLAYRLLEGSPLTYLREKADELASRY